MQSSLCNGAANGASGERNYVKAIGALNKYVVKGAASVSTFRAKRKRGGSIEPPTKMVNRDQLAEAKECSREPRA